MKVEYVLYFIIGLTILAWLKLTIFYYLFKAFYTSTLEYKGVILSETFSVFMRVCLTPPAYDIQQSARDTRCVCVIIIIVY